MTDEMLPEERDYKINYVTELLNANNNGEICFYGSGFRYYSFESFILNRQPLTDGFASGIIKKLQENIRPLGLID